MVVLGNLHINLLLDFPGGRAFWNNEYYQPRTHPATVWKEENLRAPMH